MKDILLFELSLQYSSANVLRVGEEVDVEVGVAPTNVNVVRAEVPVV